MIIRSGPVERSYPFVIGLFSAIAVMIFMNRFHMSLSDSVKDLFSSAINVGAIATGFLGTMQSILLTGERRRSIEFLKEADKFRPLLDYLVGAIGLCISAALLSGVVLFLEQHKAEEWYGYVVAVWFGLTAWAAAGCYRALSIMAVVLKG